MESSILTKIAQYESRGLIKLYLSGNKQIISLIKNKLAEWQFSNQSIMAPLCILPDMLNHLNLLKRLSVTVTKKKMQILKNGVILDAWPTLLKLLPRLEYFKLKTTVLPPISYCISNAERLTFLKPLVKQLIPKAWQAFSPTEQIEKLILDLFCACSDKMRELDLTFDCQYHHGINLKNLMAKCPPELISLRIDASKAINIVQPDVWPSSLISINFGSGVALDLTRLKMDQFESIDVGPQDLYKFNFFEHLSLSTTLFNPVTSLDINFTNFEQVRVFSQNMYRFVALKDLLLQISSNHFTPDFLKGLPLTLRRLVLNIHKNNEDFDERLWRQEQRLVLTKYLLSIEAFCVNGSISTSVLQPMLAMMPKLNTLNVISMKNDTDAIDLDRWEEFLRTQLPLLTTLMIGFEAFENDTIPLDSLLQSRFLSQNSPVLTQLSLCLDVDFNIYNRDVIHEACLALAPTLQTLVIRAESSFEQNSLDRPIFPWMLELKNMPKLEYIDFYDGINDTFDTPDIFHFDVSTLPVNLSVLGLTLEGICISPYENSSWSCRSLKGLTLMMSMTNNCCISNQKALNLPRSLTRFITDQWISVDGLIYLPHVETLAISVLDDADEISWRTKLLAVQHESLQFTKELKLERQSSHSVFSQIRKEKSLAIAPLASEILEYYSTEINPFTDISEIFYWTSNRCGYFPLYFQHWYKKMMLPRYSAKEVGLSIASSLIVRIILTIASRKIRQKSWPIHLLYNVFAIPLSAYMGSNNLIRLLNYF